MCPIRHNSLLVHVAYPKNLGTNYLVVVAVKKELFRHREIISHFVFRLKGVDYFVIIVWVKNNLFKFGTS